MLELRVKDTKVQTGTTPISWSVSPDTLKMVVESGQEAHLLLVVRPEGEGRSRHERRKLVPLKDLMTYIEFRRPGKNRVFGLVMVGTKKELADRYLRRQEGEWWTDVVDYNGEKASSRFSVVESSIDVEVPPECFAKEPPAWEKAWVNRFFRERPADQCNFRRRRLFAYTIQPLMWIATVALWTLPVVFSLLLGKRSINFRVLIDPWHTNLEHFDDGEKGTIFWPHVKEWDRDDYSPIGYIRMVPVMFMPIFVIPGLVIAKFVFGATTMQAALLVLGTLMSVGVVLFMLVAGFLMCADHLEKRTEREPIPEPKRMIISADETDALVQAAPRFTIGDLPPERRTFRLRFQQVKAALCRPFAQ